jgi:GT2 family glycosyltransferase
MILYYLVMDIDVIIPSRGTPIFTEACLNSVGTKASVIEDSGGRGFAYCCNAGMAKTKARWVVLMHSDSLVPSGWLDSLLAAHACSGGSEEVAAIVPETCLAASPFVINDAKHAFLKAKERCSPDTAKDVARIVDEALGGLDKYAAERRRRSVKAERVDVMESFCVLLSMDAIARVGPLDESFSPAGSEIDEWFIRAQRMGYECWAARGAYVHHWEGATFKALGLDRNAILADGRRKLAAAEDAFYASPTGYEPNQTTILASSKTSA